MMKKHAYLIMAHNHWKQLKILLYLIDDERNDIYIHIDKKCCNVDQTALEKTVAKSKIYFVPQVSVQWAGYSQVECELNLMECALKKQYSYLHLISGVDLPLKTQDEIHRFFEENEGQEFIQFNASPMDETYLDRIKYYHFFQEKCGRNKNIWFYLEKGSLKLQKKLKINRLKNCKLEIQKGTNWFSITSEFANYVMKQKDVIKKYFKYSCSGDEMFLQTIFVNSSFMERLYDNSFSNNHYACLRKIDWKRGNPYVFRKADFDELAASPHLFARKFDDTVDSEIIEMISKRLEGDNQ